MKKAMKMMTVDYEIKVGKVVDKTKCIAAIRRIEESKIA